VDLEKFFGRVNHDVPMGKLAGRIADKRMLGLIRRYLGAGVMVNGVAMERHEGVGAHLGPRKSELAGHERFLFRRVAVSALAVSASRFL
jgi:hypothetical protein